MVPDSFSPAARPVPRQPRTNSARIGSTAPFMVIDTAHLVERNAREQGAHVVDRIDRHAGHADIARHARVIGVIAAMGGEIECDGEALLPRPRGCGGRTRWNLSAVENPAYCRMVQAG